MNANTICPRAQRLASLAQRLTSRRFAALALPSSLLALSLGTAGGAQAQGLQVTYGAKGVQTLAYNGVFLENTQLFSADAFHIWHLKTTDLSGNVISSGQYGWGESNNGESWNAQTNTETYSFTWGTVATQFVQSGNNLNMIVTETNYANSGIILDGAEIYPFALHFPIDPLGFSGYSQYAITTTGPGVSVADFGAGVVTSVIPNESLALYGGWKVDGAATYTPIMTSTTPDNLAVFYPRNDQPVQPGSSLTYTVSLRFTPEGTAADASDAYASFAATYPSQIHWTDRRAIGTVYLASSPTTGNINQPGGYPTNPRRYFNDSSVDITNPTGLQTFQDRILSTAAASVTNAQNLNAQAVITWDVEGEQYPQTTSYVCSPDQIGAVAPEMESTITDRNSAFFGQKLDDAYFKTITNAGLRVGLCLRPQVFTLGAGGTASQVYLSSNAAIIANLENKARYANSRWGATVFYVDSTVDTNGGTLDPAIFQQLSTDLPNLLFIPEESTPRYYAYTAPFYSFIFHTTLGTDASIYKMYPQAFGANLINDVDPGILATYTPQLTQSVENGDILMGHVDYWQANDPTIVGIYKAAGVTGPSAPTPPTVSTPTVTWPTPAGITYGTALSGAQLDATASVPGTFTYAPAAGTVLSAGTTTLTVTFTPTDTTDYRATTSTVALTVSKATPSGSWPTPAPILYGTALSGTQLDATASVPGTFAYSPAAGTVLPVGTNTLSVTFTPTDTTDYNSVTATVNLVVTSKTITPVITWPTPAAIAYGTALSGAQLDATANVPGTFTYLPAAGTVLRAGTQTLSVVFTPSGSSTPLTATRTLTVNKATPQLTWPTPAAITSGTALSGTQLNASANVGGTFLYTPAAGTVPAVGTQTLSVRFTPADTLDYNTATASVSLVVNAQSSSSSKLAILSPSSSATVSGFVVVTPYVGINLDAAGCYLMVDGIQVSPRYTGYTFRFGLDTTGLSNGQHTLQLWGHDIGNNTVLSAPVTITVQN